MLPFKSATSLHFEKLRWKISLDASKKVCITNVFQDVVCDACDRNRVDKERKGIQQKKLSDKQYESNINTATEEHVSSENIPRLASLGMV